MPYPTKKLGEVLEYEQPTNYLVSSTDYKDEYPIPVLTAGKSFILGNTNERSGIFPKEKLPVIIFDDFTTAIKFVDFPFKVKSSAMKILHAKKDKADIRFLFYKMLTIKFQHEQHKRYWISECANLKIPLPPLEIQKQIVERLDKIVEAQKLNDGLIQKADELFQSLLHKELNLAGKNSEIKKLGDLAELITKGTTPTTYGRQFTNTGTPFLRAEDVNNSVVDFSRVQYHISEETNKFLSRSQTKANDILITIAGTIGRVGYVPENAPMMNMNQAVAIVRLNKITNFMYVFFLLQNKELRRKMFGAQVTGTISNLSLSNIGNLKIPLPPIEMQKQIVAKLSAVQKYKQRLIEQRKKLKELFDSVLRKSMINK